MTDDIVTRLRNTCDSNNCSCPMLDERCIYMKAADEIESLKTLLFMWRSSIVEAADEIKLLRKDCEFWEKRYWQLVAEVTP